MTYATPTKEDRLYSFRSGFRAFLYNALYSGDYAGADKIACALFEQMEIIHETQRAFIASLFPTPQTAGSEEGDPCGIDGCSGTLTIKPTENCACHIAPPCGACVEAPIWCATCGREVEDDE